MSNREPATCLLRLRDVTAWLPRLNRKALAAMEEKSAQTGDPIVSKWRPNKRSPKYYLRDAIKRNLGMINSSASSSS